MAAQQGRGDFGAMLRKARGCRGLSLNSLPTRPLGANGQVITLRVQSRQLQE
jgi:hypothetical protein